MTTEITAARYGVKYGYVDGDNGWGAGVNYDLALLDVMLNPYLLSITQTAAPLTPADGDSYYVPPGATGGWSTAVGKIAAYQNSQWNFYTPPHGLRAYVVDNSAFYYMGGSGVWVAEPSIPTTYVRTVAGRSSDVDLTVVDVSGAAPLNSPSLTGTPNAPTPATTDGGTRIATKDYVDAQVIARTAGVVTVNGHGGVVVLTAADVGAATSSTIATALVGYATQTWVTSQISSAAYSLPTASATVLGGVKVGSGLTIDGAGTLTAGSAYSLPTASATVLGGVKVGSGLTIDGGGTLTAGGSYSLPTASATVLGGVKVGTGLTIDGGGTLTAAAGGSATLAGLTDASITSPTTGDRLHYNGSAWVNGREPYIVAGFAPGTLSASQILLIHKFAQAVSYPANFGTTTAGEASYGGALATATGTTVVNVQKCLAASDPTVSGNWSTIGTLTWSAAGHTAALATSGGAAQSFAQGDRGRLVGPATPDGTLANVFITLSGNR